MIQSFSTQALSNKLATLERVIHSKSSLPAMLFAGTGGLVRTRTNQLNPTAKNSKNISPITLYANPNINKPTHQQRDTDDEHDTKSSCCNPHSTDAADGRDRCGKGRTEDDGRDVFVCGRLAYDIQRGHGILAGAEEAGRPSRSRAQAENGTGMDRRHSQEWLFGATQLSTWRPSQGTLLFITNGRG